MNDAWLKDDNRACVVFWGKHALYRLFSHTSGLESSTPHRTGDKNHVIGFEMLAILAPRDFFSLPSESKTYYEFIGGMVSCYGARIVLYQFAVSTLNVYDEVSTGYVQYIIKVSAHHSNENIKKKTRRGKRGRGSSGLCFLPVRTVTTCQESSATAACM